MRPHVPLAATSLALLGIGAVAGYAIRGHGIAEASTGACSARLAGDAPDAGRPTATLTIPAHTPLAVRLLDPLHSRRYTAGSSFDATLASDLVVGHRRIAAAGAAVSGI